MAVATAGAADGDWLAQFSGTENNFIIANYAECDVHSHEKFVIESFNPSTLCPEYCIFTSEMVSREKYFEIKN